jgi:hypothetical protein
MATDEQIKKSKSESVKDIANDLDKVAALSALADTEGGKVLIKSLMQDIMSDVDRISNGYKILTTQEFIGIGASLKTNIDMVRVLSRAKENKNFLEELLEKELQEHE